MRLDQRLVALGLAQSRARAKAMIEAGHVAVDGQPARGPAQPTSDASRIESAGDPNPYVSRGALKLVAALEAFALSPHGARCLDLGASTGGFTQALLAAGAARVYAVDVGREQLAPALRADPRVVDLSPRDARGLTLADLDGAPVDWIVADLSFIGLMKALAPALALARPGATLTALVKPQFEVGPERVGKGGVVRDAAAREAAAAAVETALGAAGWSGLRRIACPVPGADGNREWLLTAESGAGGG